MNKISLISFLIFACSIINAEIPLINNDEIIFLKANSGYDLFIKKKPGINSILLTDAQKDPGLKNTNYGLRTPVFHPCNGNEKRILDGKILQTKYDAYFLVDSTPEKHPKLGESYHFFLPEKVLYGYGFAGTSGELEIKPGVKINLRLFEKLYSDYTGAFLDQWIILTLSPDDNKFNSGVIENLREISNESKGILTIKKEDDILRNIFKNFIINNIPEGPDADIIFIIDTTYSMKEEMPDFQLEYPKIKEELLKKVKNPRMGIIVYRDYGDIFLNRVYDLTDDIKQIDYLISKIVIDGGGDIPEAIYEAIYELKKFDFRSENKIVFLIADAPAHPAPRGNVSKEMVYDMLKNLKIKINSICLPVK